ncbi:MAG: lipopolysaccharide kinase InaA family protein [Gemmatimonas sp.]
MTRHVVGADVSAIPALADTLVALVEAHGTLYEWAAEQPQPRALRGRAPVYVAALPETRTLVVVRHAWHGGLLAPLTGDRFRGTRRADREFATSLRLRSLGIPTTDVLGFASYHAAFGLRRVDVVSRFVPDAFDLGTIAAGLVPDIDRDDALAATHGLLARLAMARVRHPDLNVKNVLLRREVGGSLTAMIIDVDVVRWDSAHTPAHVMRDNVTRLIRSMRKWRTQFGCDLSEDVVETFARDATAMALTETIT